MYLQVDRELAAAWCRTVGPATIEDAPAIVEMLNSFHRDEEMYVPYTIDSLARRVARAPDLYSLGEHLDERSCVPWQTNSAFKTLARLKPHERYRFRK